MKLRSGSFVIKRFPRNVEERAVSLKGSQLKILNPEVVPQARQSWSWLNEMKLARNLSFSAGVLVSFVAIAGSQVVDKRLNFGGRIFLLNLGDKMLLCLGVESFAPYSVIPATIGSESKRRVALRRCAVGAVVRLRKENSWKRAAGGNCVWRKPLFPEDS